MPDKTEATLKLQIRAVPESVHTALKHLAVDERISLNALLVRILTDAARPRKQEE
jgi:predicted HicB family RNase H-like nuclease